ncbi:EamA family transporter [Chloroflexota bacterium]
MSYVLLSVLGALLFSFNNVFQRRAVLRIADATTGVLITIPMSAIIFLLILLSLGQAGSILSFSWQSYLWLAAAGIVNYTIGRSLRYSLMQLSGANISNVLIFSSGPLFSVSLAVTLLGEPLTWELAVGVSLIVFGLAITNFNPLMFKGGRDSPSYIPFKAYLLGLVIGLAWGVSPILIKVGLGNSGTPIAGAFIAHAASTLSFIPLLFEHQKRASLTTMKRGALGYFFAAGLFAATAQILRYTALGLGPASIVAPLFSIAPVFALMLSFLLNRRLEIFNRNVVFGTIIVIIGAVLVA